MTPLPLDGVINLPSQAPDLGGLIGHRIAIGSMFEIHILISGLVSGFTMLGPIAEWLGYMRRRPGYDRLAHGTGRFLVFYLLCGVAAAAAHIMTDPQSTVPTIGASGAIAGVMGAYIILWPDAQVLSIVPLFFISTLFEVPALIVIGFWALLQFLNASFLGGGMMQGQGVAYMAHVGGFVSGVVIILLLGGRRLLSEEEQWRDYYG